MKSLIKHLSSAVLVASSFVANLALAQDVCTKPITKAITTVSHLKCAKAYEIATVIHKVSLQSGIDWKLLVALIAQESSFRLDARNCLSGYTFVDKDWIINATCQDFGPTQINYKNITALGLDIEKLLTSWEYALDNTVKILSKLKRQYQDKDPIFWWSRYHSSTKELKEAYFKRVMAIYVKIEG